MLQSLKLVGVGPAPEMEMQFAPRLNVLTGDNGLGKSLFLETIWFALTGNWAEISLLPRLDSSEAKIEAGDHCKLEVANFKYDPPAWVSRHRRLDGDVIVIYALVNGSVQICDASRRSYQSSYGTIYSFEPDGVLNGTKTDDGQVICRGLIEDWVTWQEKKPETPGGQVFGQLAKILEIVSPHPEAGETIRPSNPSRILNDARTFPTIDMGYGSIPIIHASAGMQRIINLAYLITWAWQEHLEETRLRRKNPVKKIVFLMDEVENHLHPEWQRRILPALLKVLESLGDGIQVQVHVTTHSPMVLASLEPHWKDELDQLFLFALKDGKVVLKSDELGRRGTSSRWLTSRVFHLQTDRSVEAERAMDDANAVMRGESPQFFKTPEEIDDALKHTLPGQDPFWPRWLIFMGDPEK